MVVRVTRRAFVSGTTSAFGTVAFVRAPGRAAQFEFKGGSQYPSDHPSSIRQNQMWATIAQESGGRIQGRFFPLSELGTAASMLSQMRLGAIQFVLMGVGYLANIVPAANAGFLGFAYRDADEGLRVMDGALGAYLRQETTAKGLHALRTCWDSGMHQLSSSSHAIRTPEDLRGFKVQVPATRIVVDLFKAFGSIPVTLSDAETYSALQTKIVDGVDRPLVSIETARLYEVQKYISLTNHSWNGSFVTMNGDAWKALPPDLQEIIDRNNTKYAMIERRDTNAVNAAATAKLTQRGLAVNEVDPVPFRARLKPYFDFWASEFGTTVWGLLQTSLGRRLV